MGTGCGTAAFSFVLTAFAGVHGRSRKGANSRVVRTQTIASVPRLRHHESERGAAILDNAEGACLRREPLLDPGDHVPQFGGERPVDVVELARRPRDMAPPSMWRMHASAPASPFRRCIWSGTAAASSRRRFITSECTSIGGVAGRHGARLDLRQRLRGRIEVESGGEHRQQFQTDQRARVYDQLS